MKISSKDVQTALLAMGDTTRLKLIEELARQCECSDESCTSPSMGDVCCALDKSSVVSPNMFRHMKKLEKAGLITLTKSGRVTCCSLNTELLRACSTYLTSLAGNTSSS